MHIAEILMLEKLGMDSNQIRSLGKSVKGQGVLAIVGTVDIDIQIPGSAKVFLGFSVVSPSDNNNTRVQFTIKLNNETILDKTDLAMVSPDDRSLQPLGYCELTRRMEGKDVMTLTITSKDALQLQTAFYYLSGFGK